MSLSFVGFQDQIKSKSQKNGVTLSERWCVRHLTSFWGKDQFGNYYDKCYKGFKKNEKCEASNE